MTRFKLIQESKKNVWVDNSSKVDFGSLDSGANQPIKDNTTTSTPPRSVTSPSPLVSLLGTSSQLSHHSTLNP